MFLWDCFFFSLIIWFFLFFTMFSKVPALKVAFLSQKSLVRLWSSFSLELHQLGFCCGCTHHSLPFLEIMVVWPPEAFSELCLTAVAFLIQSNGRKAEQPVHPNWLHCLAADECMSLQSLAADHQPRTWRD